MYPVFKLGWLGVQLFFMISGFVIFMTLEKTASLQRFLYKRWLRLFPAMLIASILIFLTVPIFSERPGGEPQLLDLLPGLTFMEPRWWSRILGTELASLEGAFWSLYVEFKFYLIAGTIYFTCGRRYLVPALFLMFACSAFASRSYPVVDIWFIDVAYEISTQLSFKHFGWFAAGAAFYLYHQCKLERWFILALGIAFLSSIFVRNLSLGPAIGALVVSSLFALSLKSPLIQNLLQSRVLLFFGLISYPLYLLHENSMISMVMKMPVTFSWLPSFFYPFISISILSGASYLIANNYEVVVRKWIEAACLKLSKPGKASRSTSR